MVHTTYNDTAFKLKTKSKKIADLKLIGFHDLTLEKVHFGCYLELKFVAPCFKMNSICGLIEDHLGQDLLEIIIYNFDQKGKHYDAYFSLGAKIYLKEPFFKTSRTGGHVLRVDDPSDIVFVS